ncbi:MAG: HAMP domain-containing histidine kinase [Oscillospiraceae bacterium]|nr:HAMP domain-containing histidine kinase [Oscillospiraceae bacterium]
MKHSLTLKFIVLLLTAFTVIAALAGGAGIIAMENANLYVDDVSKLQDMEYESIAKTIAQDYANLYAVDTYGNLPYLLEQSLYNNPEDRVDAGHWTVTVYEEGRQVSAAGSVNGSVSFSKTFQIQPLYPILDEPEEDTQQDPQDPTAPTEPDTSPTDYLYRETETVWENGRLVSYILYYYEAPQYSVTVSLQPNVLINSKLQILTTMFPHRYTFIGVFAVSLILFAAGLSYLCIHAGRTEDGTVRPGGLNRLPLDLYAVLVGVGIALLLLLFRRMSVWINSAGPHFGNLSLSGSVLLGICLLALALILAFAAQVKVENGFLWKHTLIGRLLILLAKGLRFLARGLVRVIGLMPIMWQWLLAASLVTAGTGVFFFLSLRFGGIFTALLILSITACIGFLCYSGYAIGILIQGVQQMRSGDLQRKISTKYLRGSFRSLAQHLNALSDTAMIAAEREMRSERMKSELITNISHDIKTPLTSIINFVDLLQKSPSEKESEEYLQVLSRQSVRMKKLIEDLMELSKANSGNITANITTLDAAESVNQALGEFSDKFSAAQLEPMFQIPQTPIAILADGRLVWRVLSNLMSNAVKYAMPGTRLYIELEDAGEEVHLSLKNISREPLNISTEDLLERFVRGDAARSSEGSGLGLNIAKSLMEIQHGQLQLQLDGDLFKATLIFPKAS